MAYNSDILEKPYIVYNGYIVEKQYGTPRSKYNGINILVYKRGDSTPIGKITFDEFDRIVVDTDIKLPGSIRAEITTLVYEKIINPDDFREQTNSRQVKNHSDILQ